MKKLILILLLFGSSVYAQQNAKEVNTPVKGKGEDAAQLAVDWLIKGNIEKYKFYKDTKPKFTAIQIFDLSNLLENWVDDNKHIAVVEQISKQIVDEIGKKIHEDTFSRMGILFEVNAMANAKLGNIDIAMINIEKSGENAIFRTFPYFRNSKANYLNRLGAILSAAGQHQRALDTLSNALRTATSTPRTIITLKAVYQKAKGSSSGVEQYIAALQDEAYQKIAKEVEKAWITETKPVPDITLTDINGKAIKLTDYKGKIVVIDFWSTVCKPCVAAFPAFERAVDFYKNEPFQLFVINEGETPDIVKPYMTKKGYKLNVLFDQDEAIFKALGAVGTPQKFIIDADGNINQTGIGYAGSDDKEFYKLKAMVELTKARFSGKSAAN